jgi:hypothetical protein
MSARMWLIKWKIAYAAVQTASSVRRSSQALRVASLTSSSVSLRIVVILGYQMIDSPGIPHSILNTSYIFGWSVCCPKVTGMANARKRAERVANFIRVCCIQ